jgi:hypothetical protein
MYVNRCMDILVQTSLYTVSFTTTLHFPSSQFSGFSLATPASLSFAQEPLLLSSLLQVPVISFLQLTDHPGTACHIQTATVTGLPHTHCYTLAIGCCIVTAAHLGARPLVLAELVRNGRA